MMRWNTGLALCGALFVTAGCGSNSTGVAPLAGHHPGSHQSSALEYPRTDRDWPGDETYGLQSRDATRRHPVVDRPKKEAQVNGSDALLSPAWAKEQQVGKEDWERQLERRIN